ncbi:MAG: T9SS type A sorting domain-containing protein [Bacteroidota bacterium]
MKIIYKITVLFHLIGFSLQAQTLDWAVSRNFHTGYSFMPFDMKASNFSDANYILGQYYKDSLISGVLFQVSPVFTFLSKVNTNGDTLWKWNNTTTATGVGSGMFPSAMAIDNDDNIYISGIYSMNAPGLTMSIGTTLMPTSPYYYGGFLAKFDSTGHIQWVRAISAPVNYNDLDIDINGNLYLLGNVQSSVTYGSTVIHTSASNLYRDFIISYDSSGTLLWAKGYGEIDLTMTTISQKGALLKLVVDKGATPNIYAAGYFLTPYNAIGNTFTSAGAEDALILKLDNNGNYINGMQAGTANPEVFYDMQINEHSEIVLGTTYRYGTTINGTSATSTGWNTMLIKIDTLFNYKFVNNSILSAFEPAVAIDKYGRSALAVGDYFGNPTSTFDYLQVYDSTGTLIFTKSVTGAGTVNYANVNFRAVVFPKLFSNELFIAGDYKPSMTIDVTTLTSVQSVNFDIALIKFALPTNITTGMNQLSVDNEITIYPNPFTSQTSINFAEQQTNTTIKITNILGQVIKTINFTGKQLKIYKAEMTAGIYFVQTTDEQKHICNKKIIIQ